MIIMREQMGPSGGPTKEVMSVAQRSERSSESSERNGSECNERIEWSVT